MNVIVESETKGLEFRNAVSVGNLGCEMGSVQMRIDSRPAGAIMQGRRMDREEGRRPGRGAVTRGRPGGSEASQGNRERVMRKVEGNKGEGGLRETERRRVGTQMGSSVKCYWGDRLNIDKDS